MKNQYYDGAKLLSTKDLDGEKPSIYICVGNRTAGKTVFFKRMLVNAFLNKGHEFMLVFRNAYELQGVAEPFFKDIENLFFRGMEMDFESVAKGLYYRLYLDGKVCGYVVSLSMFDKLKKYSSDFVNVENIFFDEFQTESNKYLKEETEKFESLIVTVSRGQGKQFREIRIILCSNTVTVLNPYYVLFGIHKRLRKDTKILKGRGWVLEQTYNENASKAIEQSAFAKAIGESKYLAYAKQNVYLNDNLVFVSKMTGRARYKCTIHFNNKFFSIREFSLENTVYISNQVDMTFPIKLAFQANDHNANTLLLSRNQDFIKYLRSCFNAGVLRFQNLECKNMVFDILSI